MSTWPPKTNYAAGDILTAAQMTDIGNDLNDVYNTASSASAKNFLINGNYDIWQRGTSFANPSNYMVDRWTTNGAGGSITFSRETTGAPNGSRYILRATSTAGSSYYDVCQYIETSNVELLWGKTVTASIKLRRNATLNNSGMNLVIGKSSTADAGSGATWTTLATASATLAQLPTGTTSADWYTLSVTFTVPNDGTANSLRFNVQYNGATQNGSIVEYSQAQLEIGSIVTPFARAGGTIQGELAACQYYYRRWNFESTDTITTGFNYSTTAQLSSFPMGAPMRSQPLISSSAGTTFNILRAGGSTNATSIAFYDVSPTSFRMDLAATGLTTGDGVVVQGLGGSTYLEASAEL